MTLRKFIFEIEGLFKDSGEIKLGDPLIGIPAPNPNPMDSEPGPKPHPEPDLIPGDFVNIKSLGVQPIDSQIEGLTYRGNYYAGQPIPEGDGFWICYDNGVQIIKVRHGVRTVETAISYIGTADFLKLDLSDTNLYIPRGTYIQLQGAGVNTLWYQKTKSISGEGTLIGIKNDQSQTFNKISTKVQGLRLINIIVDSESSRHADQILKRLTINLDPLEKSRNPITVDSLSASIIAEKVIIDTVAQLRSGFYIDHAKSVSIRNSEINASYADNGVRVSRVQGKCEVIGNKSGKGFNTAFQASANREALSVGFKFDLNMVDAVLEEGVGFDSYANSLALLPVITKFYISKIFKDNGLTVVEIEKLYYIEEVQRGSVYRNKEVNTSHFLSDPSNYLFVIESGEFCYMDFRVLKSETYNLGDSLRLFLDTDVVPLAGTEAALVTGFYKCSASNNWINGVVPRTNQPGHALSLWGGGFHTIISGNTVNGGRSGLNMASLGAFGVEAPDYFCHAIGNRVEKNKFYNTQTAFRITSEYSRTKKGYANQFVGNEAYGGEFLINNQLEFLMRENTLVETTGTIENVSGVFEGGKLIDTIVTVKNCPNLRIGDIDLVGKSDIIRK
ncbi:hypothetical protein J2X69_004217 [Algoriphagus sp. 4150]|uniref:hypothetical protein n=1 Tax=Algoriphagus sp. 4150 TaxID=2817756 RepID=UPI00286236B1|nr:hypothetical protein [Algoriphagus sp. 4150]MDR7131852.1 hypothetical protein [Algoriphagus sp. 4150]